jgi:hypothetical protein
VAWMREQISGGFAEEIDAPAGERRFRHIPTGSVWRLIPDDNPYGPGFWPADDGRVASGDPLLPPAALPQTERDRRGWPPR